MQSLEVELEETRARLKEAEETLQAIRQGEVDGLVIEGPTGPQVYTIKSADSPYRLLVEQMQEGAATLTMDGMVIFANQSLGMLLETRLERLSGTEFARFVDPASARDFAAMLTGDVRAGAEREITLRGGDGRSFPAYVSVKAVDIFDVVSICLVVFDLTPQKLALAELAEANARLRNEVGKHERTLAALRESEQRLEMCVRAAQEGVWEYDIEKGTLWWNDTYNELYGVRPENTRLSPQWWFDHIHPDDRARVRESFFNAIRGTADRWTSEYRYLRPDGSYAEVLDRAVIARDAGGEARRMLGGMLDVTEQKSAERRLRETQAVLNQAHKLKAIGQLTSGIAHDFNNLLTTVSGNLDLIQLLIGENARIRKHAEAAQRAIRHAATLTARLLVFSRKKMMAPEVAQVDQLVRDFEEMIVRAARETVSVQVVSEFGIWPCRIDPTEFAASLLNLVINARDAMPGGGRLVIGIRNATLGPEQVAHWDEVDAGDYVVVSVSDTGSGISSRAMEHIFEPFFTTKDVGQGSGLGLAMVWGFCKQSGGHVTAESAPGQGTTITLYLPRSEGASRKEEATPGPALSKPPGMARILVVEDNADVLTITRDTLAASGYEVITASSGAEALGLLQNGLAIDLIVSDVIMPHGVSGVELARAATRLRPGLKLLLTSGYADEILSRNGASRDEFPLLSKPYRQSQLLEAVEALLEGRPWTPKPASLSWMG